MLENDKNLLLDEEELVNVAGGTKKQIIRVACQFCKGPFYANIMKSVVKCPYCRKDNTFAG
jgi:hypothetical protein